MMQKKRTNPRHWPVMVLGFVVAAIFLTVLVTFEVRETDHALLLRFSRPVMTGEDEDAQARLYKPGLHLKWPFPVDQVWRHDKRVQCYELDYGQIEQIQTADNYQIVVTTYVLWRVGDPLRFRNALGTTEMAEEKIGQVVRNGRKTVLSRHKLTALINEDAEQVRLDEIEDEIVNAVSPVAAQSYGVDIIDIGFKHLGFPEQVTGKVFERMRAERNRKSAKYRSEGQRDAQKIRSEADEMAESILTDARSEAQRIRGEGDTQAAEQYARFEENPELAAFLRKLQSLRTVLDKETTIVLDTRTPPYDLLLPDALDISFPSKDLNKKRNDVKNAAEDAE